MSEWGWLHGSAGWLALSAALAAVAALFGWRRQRALRRALGPRWAGEVGEVPALGERRGRGLLRLGAAAAVWLLATAAWLGPHGRHRGGEPGLPGLDVVVCLDVSRSMLARDEAPHRLGAAKQALKGLVRAAPENRYGLVLFAGEARLAAPLTGDVRAFEALLDAATPLSLDVGGSDVGAALEVARAALSRAGRPGGAVLLVGDGEDLAGGGDRAAAALSAEGWTLHTAGFGTSRGALIPVSFEGRGEQHLLDGSGEPVRTRKDEDNLRRWARAGGGLALVGTELGEVGALALGRAARARAAGDEPQDRYPWPLLAAILAGMWVLGPGIRPPARRAGADRGGRFGPKVAPGVGFAVFALAVGAGGWERARLSYEAGDVSGARRELRAVVEAAGETPSARLLVDAALASLAAGALDEAEGFAERASRSAADESERARAQFLLAAARQNLALARAGLALEPGAPAALLEQALARARDALGLWRKAAERGPEEFAIETLRNAERTAQLVARLEAALGERARAEPEAAPPPEPEPPDQVRDERPLPPAPEPANLSPKDVQRLMELLDQKALEAAQLRAQRRTVQGGGERDW